MSERMVQMMLIAAIVMLVALLADTAMLFAIAFPVLMFAWMVTGALKNGTLGTGYRFSLVGVLVVWLVGFISMNLMDTASEPSTYILGFPPATNIMLWLVWIVPAILVSYLYGYFFERDSINPEELRKLDDRFICDGLAHTRQTNAAYYGSLRGDDCGGCRQGAF